MNKPVKIQPVLFRETAANLISAPTSAKETSLIDGFSRSLSYLRLSITDLCNFKCDYCLPNGYQGKKQPNELSVSEIGHLIEGFAEQGIKKIRLTGGEPTLRKDLPEIIKTAKATKGIEKVALTTNGYRMEQLYPQWLDAGIDQINISIDSFDSKTFQAITGHDALDEILRSIDQLHQQQFYNIKINVVLMKETVHNAFIDALTYAKTHPVTIRFIELMQTNDNHNVFFSEHLSANSISKYLNQHGWKQQQRQQHGGPALEFSHPGYIGNIGLIAPYQKGFCESCNRLRISSQGKLHLCLFDSQAFDLRPLLRINQQMQLQHHLEQLLDRKPEHHFLKQNNSGLINHLAMIGG